VELDPRLCTVDELMEFSPDRSHCLVAGDHRSEEDVTPVLGEDNSEASAHCPAVADALQPSQQPWPPDKGGEDLSSSKDLADNQWEEVAEESPRLESADQGHVHNGGSPCSDLAGARTGNDLCESSSLAGPALAAGPRPEESDSLSSFFVRRPQEEYSRLESVESSLTLMLRRQAMRDENWSPSGGSRGSSRRGYADMVGTPQRGSGFEVRVHLPPFDEESVLVKAVPSTMRVSTLVAEVLRQRGSSSSGLSWELRLYDEDEEEPDYDCPPFDQNLQVGCLNVSDVALCMEASAHGTPPSPLQMSLAEVGVAAVPPSAVTPEAPGRGILGKVFDSPKRKTSEPEVKFPQPDWGSEEPRQGSWSHRRTRSMPHVAVQVPDALPHGHSEANLLSYEALAQAAMSVSSHRDLESVRRRPPTPAFFFNVYTASIATEYPVTVGLKGSRSSPSECNLVVNRERLHHRAPRGGMPHTTEKDQKKVSFMPGMLKKLGRQLALSEAFRSDESFIYIDRCVHDIRHIATDEDTNPLSFSITYSSTSPEIAGTLELTYQAQTPTERAEIVARLHFLMMLVAKR